jgi:hypothetical protein
LFDIPTSQGSTIDPVGGGDEYPVARSERPSGKRTANEIKGAWL